MRLRSTSKSYCDGYGKCKKGYNDYQCPAPSGYDSQCIKSASCYTDEYGNVRGGGGQPGGVQHAASS